MTRKSIYLPKPGMSDSVQPGLVPDAAVRGRFLFSCGVAGFDENGKLPATHEDQAALAFDRLGAVLSQADFTADDLGHWFNWAPDRLVGLTKPNSKIGPINPHWARWFPDQSSRPARHALARALDPRMQYRIEVIGIKDAPRRSYEVSERVFHTGGTSIPGFMPFGTTSGDILFTGPTFGMDDTGRLGTTADEQAKLCRARNDDLFKLTGHSLDNIVQMYVWYHNDESRAAAIRATASMFPDPQDRPAIHYLYSELPYLPPLKMYNDVQGQFLIQYDIIAIADAKRKVIHMPKIAVKDGENGAIPAGVVMRDLCFTSVCLGIDQRRPQVEVSLVDQARTAFRNAKAVVETGEFESRDIGHVYVWYRDHASRDIIDRVWTEEFPNFAERPARHCVVADLPSGALVGVEMTAAQS